MSGAGGIRGPRQPWSCISNYWCMTHDSRANILLLTLHDIRYFLVDLTWGGGARGAKG